jgi:hypothetical protein
LKGRELVWIFRISGMCFVRCWDKRPTQEDVLSFEKVASSEKIGQLREVGIAHMEAISSSYSPD